ncbi:hypothetical protein OAO87_03725 [bacterium]|nr:hypothetical protein [bacterium]
MAWQTPRQAAERQVDAAVLFLERLDASAQARRGMHRFLNIANAHGLKGANFAGIKLDGPSPKQQPPRREDNVGKKAGGSKKGKPRNKSEACLQKDRENLETKWQKRREKEQQQQCAVSAGAADVALRCATCASQRGLGSAWAACAADAGCLFDVDVDGRIGEGQAVREYGRLAGVTVCRRWQTWGAAVARCREQAIAAIRALPKKGREGSPEKGLNPNAIAFQSIASAEQSGQHIDDAANFMGTFTRPASSHDKVRGLALPQAVHSGRSVSAGIISGNSEHG